jgi:hypothetical protein
MAQGRGEKAWGGSGQVGMARRGWPGGDGQGGVARRERPGGSGQEGNGHEGEARRGWPRGEGRDDRTQRRLKSQIVTDDPQLHHKPRLDCGGRGAKRDCQRLASRTRIPMESPTRSDTPENMVGNVPPDGSSESFGMVPSWWLGNAPLTQNEASIGAFYR